jgi:hypothetical protein
MLLKWFKLKSKALRFIYTIKFIIQQLPKIGKQQQPRKDRRERLGVVEE